MKIWKKVLAFVCVVALCLTAVQTPAKKSVAAPADVEKIVIPILDGVTYYDDVKRPMGAGGKGEYNISKENDSYVLTGKGDSFGDFVDFYVKAEEQPIFSIEGNEEAVYVEEDGSYWWIMVDLTDLDGTINMSAQKGIEKYTVTWPNNSDEYIIGGGATAGEIREVNANEQVSFTVSLKDKFKNSLVVKQNGESLNINEIKNEESTDDTIYEVTTKPITRDTQLTIEVKPQTYTITVPESTNAYTFSLVGSSTVSYGENIQFYVVPQNGYEEPVVKVNGQQVNGANGFYSYGPVTGDVKITVTAGETIHYQVNFIDSDNGEYTFEDIQSIAFKTTQEVGYNGSVSFKVKPAEGYVIKDVTANNKLLVSGVGGVYTIGNIVEDQIVRVEVTKEQYNITYEEPGEKHYSLQAGPKAVEYGENYTFYVNPEEGYNNPTVTVSNGTCEAVGENGMYILSGITANTTIRIENGSLKTQQIILNSGEGFRYVSEEGEELENTTIPWGSDFTFKIELDKNYNESKPIVEVNSVVISPENGVYKISSVDKDQVVSVANVERNIYNVTLKQGTGFELSTTESTEVHAGDTFTFSLKPELGYDISNAKVEAVGKSGTTYVEKDDNGYYNVTVNEDLTIVVTGIKDQTFSVTVLNDETDHATVKNVSETADGIKYDGSYQFTVEADEFYQIDQVAINGEEVSAVNGVYTKNNVTDNLQIEVITSEKPIVVHYVDDKYDNSEDVVYTISDIGTSSAKVKDVQNNSQVYAFDKWVDAEGIPVTEITEDMLRNETTLKATWTPVFDKLMSIVTKGNEVVNEDEEYVVTYETLFSFVEEISEEYESAVRITGYGTLYAPTKENIDTTDKEIQKAIMERDRTENPGLTIVNNVAGKQLSNYYRNRTLAPSEINGQSIGLSKYSNNPLDRWGAGWIELTVGEYSVLVFSEPEHVTYDEQVTQKMDLAAVDVNVY
ncbi:hypothetical protein B5F18_02275 [Lachnoclostridium sp. An181]|nr:hypothetical protein B5F18_02275 [Lachnoclostridium sp. An181]